MDPTYLGHPMPTPTTRKPQGLLSKNTFIIVLVLLAALVAGGFMLFSSGDNSGALQQRLSARQATTLSIIDDGQKNITSEELSKLNSELKLVLLADTNTLQSALAEAGMKKADKNIVASEADTTSLEKLKDAKLNGQYDSTYRGILTQKLESLRALSTELHEKTTSKTLKAALATEYAHLTTFLATLAEQS